MFFPSQKLDYMLKAIFMGKKRQDGLVKKCEDMAFRISHFQKESDTFQLAPIRNQILRSWFHLGYEGGGSRGLEECLSSPEEDVCSEVDKATSPGLCGMDACCQIMPSLCPQPFFTLPFLPSFPKLFGIQCFVLVCWLYPASLPWTPLMLFSFPKLKCSESSERESGNKTLPPDLYICLTLAFSGMQAADTLQSE